MKTGSLSAFLILNFMIYNKALEICEDGWSRFRDSSGNLVCTLLVKDGVGWIEAMEICEEKLGNLLVLDNFGDLTYFLPNDERAISIGQELVNSYSVEEFWSGMYVDRGRLIWDDYGPKLVERHKFQGNQYWQWGEGHPNPEEGACGKATVSKRVTSQGTIYNYNRVTVNLTACDTKLPFVCRKPVVDNVVKTAAFCPDNWIGNQYVPHCYRIYKEPVPYEKARTRCGEEGGALAPSDTLFHLYFLEAVYNFYLQNDKYFEVTTIRNIWVLDTNTTQRCSALDTSPSPSNIPRVADVDCFTSLLFICVKGTKYAGPGYIEIRSPYFDQEQLLQYPPFQQLPVYGVLDRHLRENEVIFVRTPSVILNSTNSYTQWSFDTGLYWTVQESDPVSVPFYVNISLPFNQSPRQRRDSVSENMASSHRFTRQSDYPRERRGLLPLEGEEIFRFVDYDNVRQTTGYFTFGIYNINPPRYRERPSQLVRYSERDMYIYVAYCDFLDDVIGPSSEESFISREDVNSFNLLQDDSYLGMFQEIGLGTVFFDYPAGSDFLIEYYRSQIEFFQNKTVKFRIFVVPRSGLDVTLGSEQSVKSFVYEHFEKNLPIGFFDRTTLQVRSTVMCPSLETVKNGKTLTFQPVRAGEKGFSWERCYPGDPDNKALATSTCEGGYDSGATWQQILLADDCGSVPEYNQSESTVNLKNLSETDMTNDNFEQILNETALLTTPDVNLTEGDVIYTAKILYNFLQLDLPTTPQVMDAVIKVVDNVLRSGQGVINSAQKITNAANRIILTVDELTNQIGLFGVNVIQLVEDLVASEVWEQTGSNNLTIGISLNKTDTGVIEKNALSSVQQPKDVVVMETDTAIYLSQFLLKGGKSKLTFHIYGDPGLFTVINSRFQVNSKVVAARLTKDNVPVLELGEEYVTAVFDLFENSKSHVCAYWNYSANEDAGGWGTDGCTLSTLELGRVVCKCNHLTNFAVLIDLEAEGISVTDKIVLGIITKVGLCISIAGLGFTIVTFLVFKHLRSGRGQQVLVNLSLAMLCSAILFLVGVDRTESYGGCIAVSVLLHYFILVTFMWMLVEGVLQYLRFVKVLGTYIPNFMIKSIVPAWGIPLIPVIIVLAIDYDMYYGGNGYCWLSWKPFLYAFVIPIAVIILANIIVFMLVMCNLCCRRKNKGMVSNQSERKMAFLHFQAGVSILVILGVTWVFGFLTIDNTRIVFHYLFAIFNAFQGFFIFLLFTAREKQIRKAWRKLCCKKAPYKSSTSGTDSHPRKQSADTTNSTGLLNHSRGVESENKTNFSNGDHQFGNPHYENNI